MSEWEQIGTVEILRFRIYPIDWRADINQPLTTTVAVEPGFYPVYRKYDAVCWVMTGRINERQAKIGDGLYSLSNGDEPTGVEVQFSSRVYGIEEFREFMSEGLCRPGVGQRLSFEVMA